MKLRRTACLLNQWKRLQDAEAEPKAKVPVQKWNVLFTHSAFQAFTLKHPEVIEPDDDLVKTAIMHIVETGDMNVLKIRSVIEALEEKFGSMRDERLLRTRGFIVEIVQKKLADDEKKRKAGSAGYKKVDSKDKGSLGQPEIARKVQTKLEQASDDSVTIRTDGNAVEDVTWAISVLAPLGLREDEDDIAMQPPAKKALPVLRGLQAAAEKMDLRTILRKTKIGKVVNYLRRNPDADVKRCAQELLRVFRDACAKKQKTEHPPAVKDA